MIPPRRDLNEEVRRVIRFGFVGALSTATHVLVAFLLVTLFALDPIIASVGGFFSAFTMSFFGHKRFSFRASGRYRDYLGRFSLAVLISFLASTGIVAVMTHIYHVDAGVTFAVVGISVPIMNYVFGRFWVFLRSSKPSN